MCDIIGSAEPLIYLDQIFCYRPILTEKVDIAICIAVHAGIFICEKFCLIALTFIIFDLTVCLNHNTCMSLAYTVILFKKSSCKYLKIVMILKIDCSIRVS